jgi:catechol 2,3-dioxygenase
MIMSPSPKPIGPNPRPIDAGVSIGHVHLKVADLNRAIAPEPHTTGLYHVAIRYPTRAAIDQSAQCIG